MNILNEQQKSFLNDYTISVADTILQKVNNAREMSVYTAGVVYYSVMFGDYNIWKMPSEKNKLDYYTIQEVGCKQLHHKDSMGEELEKISEIDGHFTGEGSFATDFFSSKEPEKVPTFIQSQLEHVWGHNQHIYDLLISRTADVHDKSFLGHLLLMLIVEDNTGNNFDFYGIFGMFPGSCTSTPRYRSLASQISEEMIMKDGEYTVLPGKETTDVKNQTVKEYVSRPFYDEGYAKWVSAVCGHVKFDPIEDLESSTFTFKVDNDANKKFKRSLISCVIVDMSEYLKYQDTALIKILETSKNLERLPVIHQAVLKIFEGTEGRFIQFDDVFKYNYTTIYDPLMVRFTGMTNEEMFKNFKEDEFIKDSVQISRDPSNPGLMVNHQLHLRTNIAGFYKPTALPTKETPEPKPNQKTAQSYSLKYMFYFNLDLLDATKQKIQSSIGSAQTQVSLLALVIVIIICGIVMCFSFQYQKKLSDPLQQIVHVTNLLTNKKTEPEEESILDDIAGNKDIKAINVDIRDGIYQAGSLVDTFRRILMCMNTSDNNMGSVSGPSPVDMDIILPFNELYKKSPYNYMFDWNDRLVFDDINLEIKE